MRRLVLALLAASCSTPTAQDRELRAECEIEGPDGLKPGEIVANFDVVHCDGTVVGLRDLVACRPLTLLDVGAAAYRKCREATDEYASDPTIDLLQARGLNIVQVFLYDESFGVPTLEFCSRYSAEHKVDFDFLVDQVGDTGLFSQVAPMNMVIDPDGTILYKWVGEIPEERSQILDELLTSRTQ